MPSVTNKPFMLSVIMLSVLMMSVLMMNVIMLSVIMLNVIILNVVAPNFSSSCYLFKSKISKTVQLTAAKCK